MPLLRRRCTRAFDCCSRTPTLSPLLATAFHDSHERSKVLVRLRERWEQKCREKGLLNEPPPKPDEAPK